MAAISFQQIPNFQNLKFVDPETGYLTPEWNLLMSQLVQNMQNNTNQGLVPPTNSNSQITTDIQPNAANGTLIYNSDTDQPMINVNGTFKTIMTF